MESIEVLVFHHQKIIKIDVTKKLTKRILVENVKIKQKNLNISLLKTENLFVQFYNFIAKEQVN